MSTVKTVKAQFGTPQSMEQLAANMQEMFQEILGDKQLQKLFFLISIQRHSNKPTQDRL